MRQKKHLLPKHQRILEQVGENLKLARLRRRLTVSQVAERAGISRNTLYLLEKGRSSSSIATLFQVMFVLGLQEDFLKLGQDDVFGRRLQDAGLLAPRKRAPKASGSKKHPNPKRERGTTQLQSLAHASGYDW